MGDMGDIFNSYRQFNKERGRNNLAKADPAGWNQHTDWHWSRELLGSKLDYWPSKNKFMWRGKVMTGNVLEFIAARDKVNG